MTVPSTAPLLSWKWHMLMPQRHRYDCNSRSAVPVDQPLHQQAISPVCWLCCLRTVLDSAARSEPLCLEPPLLVSSLS